MRRTLMLIPILALTALTACGGDDSASDSTKPDAAPTATTATDETTVVPAATTATTATAAAATTGAPSGSSSLPDCPDEESVSAAVGVPIVVDPEPAVTAAGFCPYVGADGSGDLTMSLTFTPLDVTEGASDAAPEAVPGVGQAAWWSPSAGELVVWTGEFGIIANILTFGTQYDALDQKAATVALAKLAID